MVSSPITCCAATHWASTAHGMRRPQHKKAGGAFRPLERGLQQAYPRAGGFRINGLLGQHREEAPPSERTVGRAMALNRQFHGAPGPWPSARDAQADMPSFKHLPYRPAYRHHLWFTDIRYLVQLEGSWV